MVNVQDGEYVAKVAWNLEEACKLLEAGFDYVTDMENANLQKTQVALQFTQK
jgi:hypothetical protein